MRFRRGSRWGGSGFRPAAENCQSMRVLCVVVLVLVSGLRPSPAQGLDSALEQGRSLFDSYCSACHQYDDGGMGEAPPLDDSPWVTGPAERLVRILLHGVEGPIDIDGKIYDREMPGFGGSLTDSQIAALATYTRSRFGARNPRVTAREVQRIRAEHAGRNTYWQAGELLEIR